MGVRETIRNNSSIYIPEITEQRRHQIQETNKIVIINAAKACSQIATSVGKSMTIPLDGLDLNNKQLEKVQPMNETVIRG